MPQRHTVIAKFGFLNTLFTVRLTHPPNLFLPGGDAKTTIYLIGNLFNILDIREGDVITK